jgi:drug/metabolite transporter (DMT)-like permease
MSERRASTHGTELLLLLVPMLWGLGYPLIRGSMEFLGPLGFLFLRFGSALVPIALLFRRSLRMVDRGILRKGVLTGIALFFAYAFLNWGLVYTTTAKAGFIIGLRVILVPLTGALVFRLRAAPASWIAAAISLAGLAFIFFGEFEPPLQLNPGDGLMTASAFFFALHVLLVSRYVVRENYAPMLVLQIAVVVLLSGTGSALFEVPVLPAISHVWLRALGAGLLSTALAFWLQNRFQFHSTADRTGIIFSSEPLFAALFGFIILGETLQGGQWIGAGLIITAMLLARLPDLRRSNGS